MDDRGLPEFDHNTWKLKERQNVFIAGDVNGQRPLLHDAHSVVRIACAKPVESLKTIPQGADAIRTTANPFRADVPVACAGHLLPQKNVSIVPVDGDPRKEEVAVSGIEGAVQEDECDVQT